jgi:hypothetical protein
MTSIFLVSAALMAKLRPELERLRNALRAATLVEADALATELSTVLGRLAKQRVRVPSDLVDAAREGRLPGLEPVSTLLARLSLDPSQAHQLVDAATHSTELVRISRLRLEAGDGLIILPE